ncbi:response regulator transcription factor [Burkholderia pyrrocinia]|uniref:response regulator transcription factor n=1 Tax=Burkholderia pyrrocinia TaxID=60550 RepID=UPI001575CDEC|nr:response regulator transcription factor [Burkholderia pyrrocinia]NTX31939.1 response regulator transcription factor [Burkholderia pyrrocinia]
MTIQVLVVEPDLGMRDMIRAFFHGCQLRTSALHDVSMLLACVAAEPPSLIVLRIGDPGISAYTALREMRGAGHDMPVIVLSDSAAVVDKVIALEAGADDYLVDPFDLMELVARVRRAARRYRSSGAGAAGAAGQPERREPYRFDEIEVDFVNRRATRAGTDLGLRASEFALLELFVSHPMQVLSRAAILSLLGQNAEGRSERGLDVLVFRLRSLIEHAVGDYHYIRTVRGRGYIFVPSWALADDNAHDEA